MVRRVLAAAAAWLLLTAQASPPPSPDPLAIVVANTLPTTIARDGRMGGAGWDALLADAQSAQFVMVGEQHGSGSIAELETALQAALVGAGFDHAALEIGPVSAVFAENLLRQRPGALREYIAAQGNGFTIPFLWFDEELAMAAQFVASSPDKKRALWGLDQEFIGAVPILSRVLEEQATTPARRRMVAALRAEAAANPLLVGSLDGPELDRLEAAFAGNRAALSIVEEMRRSNHIYRPFLGRGGSGYLANLERETWMKRNFLRSFEEAERRNGKPPKVFLKFGGSHAMRGMTSTDVPGLANFLAEWGQAKGHRLVNVMIDCVGGEAMNPQTNIAGPCENYFGPTTLIGRAVANGPTVQIVDLRALRPLLGKLQSADPESRKIILAFDWYVAVRDGKAATPIGRLIAKQ